VGGGENVDNLNNEVSNENYKYDGEAVDNNKNDVAKWEKTKRNPPHPCSVLPSPASRPTHGKHSTLANLFRHHPEKDTASHGTPLLPIGKKGVLDQRIGVVAVVYGSTVATWFFVPMGQKFPWWQ
jgi:hypothetical protein